MMGPDISKGLHTQASAQACHKDGGNQVRMINKFTLIYCLLNKIDIFIHNNE